MTRLGAIPWPAVPVLVPLAAALLLWFARGRDIGLWIARAGAVLTLAASLALAWLHPADRLAALAAPLAAAVGVAITLAMPAWIVREIGAFRLAAANVPRALAAGQVLLAGVMLAVVAPEPAIGWLGMVVINLALLLPLALAWEPVVRRRGRALLGVGAIGLVVALLGAAVLGEPGGGWRPVAARADGALAWLGTACLLLGGATGAALALLAGREDATPGGGLSGFAALLALLVLGLRLPASDLVVALGVAMVLAGAAWAARAGMAADWVAAAALAQAGMVLAAGGTGSPAGRFAALVQLALLALTRIAGRPAAAGMLALAGLPPFGLFAGLFLVLSAIAAASVALTVVLAVAMLPPALRLARLAPPMAWAGWRDLPGWALLALGGALGLAMPAPLVAWIDRVAAAWP